MALPVALQLYSVRDQLEKDFEGTIKQVAEMGYTGVELSGFPDAPSPAEIRAILDKYGLTAMSSHCPFAQMQEEPDRIFESAHICGLSYLAIPWLNAKEAYAEDAIEHTLAAIEDLGKKAKDAGLTLLYHNHDFEFQKIDGEYILDRIYRCVPADYLKTQLDTCWIRVAGEDPAKYLKKYTGRAPLVHLKDFSGHRGRGMYGLIGSKESGEKQDSDFRFQPIGSGVQDIMAILNASQEAGAEWVVVEQDSSPDMPTLEAARVSRNYLRSLGW